MTAPDEITILRINVLGELEVIQEPGKRRTLPTNARACHLLAMLPFKTAFDAQELVDIFWQGETLHHPDPKEVKRVEENLNQVYAAVRRTLGIVGRQDILTSNRRTVRWLDNPTHQLTTDLDEFQALARSGRPDAALALVRGPVADHLPQERKLIDSFGDARQRQRQEIEELLRDLDPAISDDALEDQVKHVLKGEYRKGYLSQQSIKGDVSGSPLPAPTAISNRVHRSVQRWKLRAAALAGCALALGIMVWAVWPGSTHTLSIPPPGSVVDAQTGQVVHFVPHSRAAKLESQELEVLLWVCDVSTKQPCMYPKSTHPLVAHRGDMLEIWIRLYNETDILVPLVGVTVGWRHTYEYPERFSTKQIFVVYDAAFDRPNGKQIDRGTTMGLHVQMLPKGEGITYLPSYIPGSTVLTSSNPAFRHALPDGIMQEETKETEPSPAKFIWLSNVGAPPSACAGCVSQHMTFIHFRVRML